MAFILQRDRDLLAYPETDIYSIYCYRYDETSMINVVISLQLQHKSELCLKVIQLDAHLTRWAVSGHAGSQATQAALGLRVKTSVLQ